MTFAAKHDHIFITLVLLLVRGHDKDVEFPSGVARGIDMKVSGNERQVTIKWR